MLRLELPFPPSVNHYWRRVGPRTLISRGGRAFRQAVCSILAAQGVRPMDGPLEIFIDLYPPDRRRRDADNANKALLDALAHGGAYFDDSQLVHIDIWKRYPVLGGKTVVRLRPVARGVDQPEEKGTEP
ncbi:MAG: RusA family crossover junction endodeoxyribonuclease [Pirellulales bacterium]